MAKKKIAILIGGKGRGSNMVALARSLPGQVGLVISPSADAPAMALAIDLGLAVTVCPYGPGHEESLWAATERFDLLCLAGYLRLLPESIPAQLPVLNIHPSLLPKFGGKGMFGMHVHEAVRASGETETGCTVHRVSARYDEGEILAQTRCPIYEMDSAEAIARRVLALEHLTYPAVVRKVLEE